MKHKTERPAAITDAMVACAERVLVTTAFERMIEHHVYWALVGARWVDADNFAKGPSHFFDSAPLHLREKMREDAQFRVAENYLLSGLGRHDRTGRRRCSGSRWPRA